MRLSTKSAAMQLFVADCHIYRLAALNAGTMSADCDSDAALKAPS